MKRTMLLIVAFYGLVGSLLAQERVVNIHSGLFESHERIFLAPMDEWIFKKGHHDSWAQPGLDVRDWEKMSLAQISPVFKDENGRIEGWFRMKIRLDDSLKDTPLYLGRSLWAATDIYLDGRLIHSFGNTGNPYRAFNPILKYPVPVELETQREYLLAVHFVDYESAFTQREIRLSPQNLRPFLNLTGTAFISWVDREFKLTHIYVTLCLAVSFLLCFLYWFLVYLNPDQTIFRIIAWFTTAVLIGTVVIFGNTFFEISYPLEKVRFLFSISLQATLVIFGLFILEWILTQRTSKTSWAILASLLVANILAHVFSISFPFAILFMVMMLHFGRLFLTHANSIRGAKWAILAGYVISTLATVVYIGLHKYDLDLYNEYDKLLVSITILTTPLFLLAYISVRFKEILAAQKLEANRVLEIAEEKKEILANQNLLLERQVDERTLELKNSLETLKSTQSQLIQQEKLASLGQLTAGIAHEIKNPLNFVNNFSEVSLELVEEIQDIRRKTQEVNLNSEEDEILEDIKTNLQKIHEHGSRANGIVASMLQHSRGGSRKKEPTNLNALIKEYVNLSFHGMRAGKNPIDVVIAFELDPEITQVSLIKEDFTRVIINLCNNAYDAMRSKVDLPGFENLAGLEPYHSQLTVRTKAKGDHVIIEIEDNGPGIPDEIKDKILQPFFTTKKGTEGTGLGLSITHDIVKAHGGTLTVNSKSGLGAEFKIELPA